MPSAEVLEISRGSVVVLRDVELPLDEAGGVDVDWQKSILDAVVRAVGHDEFAIIWISGDGSAEVLSGQEVIDLIAGAK